MQLYTIYQTFQNDFKRYARSLTKDPSSADDLVQYAYLKAMNYDDLFETMHPMQIKGWFFTTIKRHFLDTIKKQNHTLTTITEGMMPYDQVFDDRLFVDDVLSVLTEDEAKLIKMRYLMGYNSSEMAKMTSLSPSTIRTKLSRSLSKMKDYLIKEAPNDLF